jgi:hypothetical protein
MLLNDNQKYDKNVYEVNRNDAGAAQKDFFVGYPE